MDANLATGRLGAARAERVPASHYIVFAAIAILGCATDLVTKAWVFSVPALRNGDILWWWGGHVGVQLSRNMGALFGMGQGKVWLFSSLGIAAVLAIPIWLFAYRAARDIWLTIALGAIMAGVMGNLFDRLGFPGEEWPARGSGEYVHAVRDWILWQASDQWRWPNFNIADSMLVIGAGVLLLHAAVTPQAADDGSSR